MPYHVKAGPLSNSIHGRNVHLEEMSTPSFSSFIPSFSTFPDLESASNSRPGNSALSSKEDRRHEKKKKTDGLSAHRRSREERKIKKRRKERSMSSHGRGCSLTREKERSLQRNDNEYQHSEYDRLFYSDRRGDPLNIQYGGLHAGDIPRYHVVNSRINFILLCCNIQRYSRY